MAEMKDLKPVSRNRGRMQRDSNLELFRIITMLLIIAHHYVTNSGLLDARGAIYSSPLGVKSIFLLLIGAWGKPGINCFLMITGYFMCQKKITAKKFCKLLFEVLFYNVVITLVFVLTGYVRLDLKLLVKAVLPINTLSRNFTGCFLVFYLCIPFLNVLVQHINEKQHKLLLLLLGFMYVILGSNLLGSVEMNYVSWFAVVYLIAAYIKLYPKPLFENRKLWGIITISVILFTAISFPVLEYFYNHLGGETKALFYFVTDSNFVVPVIFGISTFLFFKNTKVRYSKLINLLGASTFGVFCIHTNGDAMRRWLWGDVLKVVNAFNSSFTILHALGSIVLIFTVCSCVDIMRRRIIEEPFFSRYWSAIEQLFIKRLKR